MIEPEPRMRHRGYFSHVEPHSPDQVEQESAEGVSIRPASTRKPTHAVRATSLSTSTTREAVKGTRHEGVAIRSASATGSHRQSRTSR